MAPAVDAASVDKHEGVRITAAAIVDALQPTDRATDMRRIDAENERYREACLAAQRRALDEGTARLQRGFTSVGQTAQDRQDMRRTFIARMVERFAHGLVRFCERALGFAPPEKTKRADPETAREDATLKPPASAHAPPALTRDDTEQQPGGRLRKGGDPSVTSPSPRPVPTTVPRTGDDRGHKR